MKRLREWINQYYLFWRQSNETLSEKSQFLIENKLVLNGDSYSLNIAKVKDAPILVDLQKQCYPHDAIWSENLLQNELMHNPKCLYLIAYDKSLPIAFIGAWIRLDECHISNIVTIPSYQNRGIGTYLLKQIEKVARLNQCTLYTLEVRVSNENAQSLYKTMGFKIVKLKTRYYSNDLEDAYEMTKRLKNDTQSNRSSCE